MFRKFRKPRRVYSVLYESNSERYECSCKLWNSIEIPCSHIICVLKELEKDALPMRLVLKRWCKNAKSGSFHDSDGGLDSNRAFRGRYGSLWTSFLPMCLLAAQRPATYKYAAAKIAQLLKEIEAEVSKGNSSTFVHDTVDGEDILDPKIIKSKGAPRSTGNGKMARRCKRGHGFGHDRRNCTANKEDMLDESLGFDLRQSQHGGKRSCRAKNCGVSQDTISA
ncbi:hypothetical protein HN873_070553 [Arachis hypogaea]